MFFEYTVTGSPVPTDFSDDPALVFAPHVYGGSIAPLTVEQNWAYAAFLAGEYRTALWVGEYGWFGDPAEDLPKLRTFGRGHGRGHRRRRGPSGRRRVAGHRHGLRTLLRSHDRRRGRPSPADLTRRLTVAEPPRLPGPDESMISSLFRGGPTA